MPVIVTCPPRCGSTTVAEYLQEKGINMGERFQRDGWHENGGLEDMDFKVPNQAFISQYFTKRQYLLLIKDALRQRKEPWGIKDPRIAYLIQYYKFFTPTALWIRLKRDREEIIQSIIKITGWKYNTVLRMVKTREGRLDKFLPEAHVITFDQIKDGSYRKILDDLLTTYYGGLYGSLDETRRSRLHESVRPENAGPEQGERMGGHEQGGSEGNAETVSTGGEATGT